MNDSRLIRLVLLHMYALAQQTEPASVGRLAGDLGLERHAVAQALLALDRAGLIDCARVRLTLAGLAFAVTARSRTALPLAA